MRLRQQERGNDQNGQRIAAFLNRCEGRQAFSVTVFVWIEGVHEHTGVNRVPRMRGSFRA
jgi:hypothetical protein